jgi:hypothetical protein
VLRQTIIFWNESITSILNEFKFCHKAIEEWIKVEENRRTDYDACIF